MGVVAAAALLSVRPSSVSLCLLLLLLRRLPCGGRLSPLSPVPSADRRLNDLSFFVPAFLRPPPDRHPTDGNEAVDPIKNARNKRGSLSKLSRS